MARPDDPLAERVRYTKMVLNSNPIEHLVAELYKAYDYIDFLESQIAQPSPNVNPDFDPNFNPDIKRPEPSPHD